MSDEKKAKLLKKLNKLIDKALKLQSEGKFDGATEAFSSVRALQNRIIAGV